MRSTLLVSLALALAACTSRPMAVPEVFQETPSTRFDTERTTTIPAPATTVDPGTTSPNPEPTGAVVARGDGWELTDVEYEALVEFVERSHGVSFPDPIKPQILGTSGVTDLIPPDWEILPKTQWDVLSALGLTGDQTFQEANEIRRQRVRGLCCAETEEGIAVQVEDAGGEAITSVVVVHELVHAMYTQRPPGGEIPDAAFSEVLDPLSAASEGVPQWVALRYLAGLPATVQQEMANELPIIRIQDLEAGMTPAVADVFTFGYNRGAAMAESLSELGVDPLTELMDRFPASTEQVLFAQAWIDEELPTETGPIEPPPGFEATFTGRLGPYALLLTGATVAPEDQVLELVRPWAGDSLVMWAEGDAACLAAEVLMDSAEAASDLATLLDGWAADHGAATVAVDAAVISLTACTP
ncbi:MAG: hypothetical protein OEX04_18625 [Acidimicrobiia bacterium]|nr:hypothetical protein [Acidimicrobiia bacterium]MDH4309491.1 hypothetical protein [Acidimicrobiia bacterium]